MREEIICILHLFFTSVSFILLPFSFLFSRAFSSSKRSVSAFSSVCRTPCSVFYKKKKDVNARKIPIKGNSDGGKILTTVYLYCKCNSMTNKQTNFKVLSYCLLKYIAVKFPVLREGNICEVNRIICINGALKFLQYITKMK